MADERIKPMTNDRIHSLVAKLREKESRAVEIQALVKRLSKARNILADAIDKMRCEGIPDDEITLVLRRAVDFLSGAKS
jgi:hypothetical protein